LKSLLTNPQLTFFVCDKLLEEIQQVVPYSARRPKGGFVFGGGREYFAYIL
jgi:hypothetical protein